MMNKKSYINPEAHHVIYCRINSCLSRVAKSSIRHLFLLIDNYNTIFLSKSQKNGYGLPSPSEQKVPVLW